MTLKVVADTIMETRTVTRVESLDDLKREAEMLAEEIKRAQDEVDRAQRNLDAVNIKIKMIEDSLKAVVK